ncbi:TonB-dependent siderophore receptor [Halarcobacter ebronensis]|uniref:TonB-dependent siderophore receptor n=1 Tax=Halarcobacter ebronensis TaxID=1462615 RepID=A0A4Q1AP06_9BACT|nr:TonB-dependent siderophore receptor [Halarcobacter ebronensis]QKF81006.1 TonB-dependent siderophore receptor [Halarcobacter ebronensis]RXK06320.1 TonB-dependent siderophore receptor [Halarcobacter ebronensis]
MKVSNFKSSISITLSALLTTSLLADEVKSKETEKLNDVTIVEKTTSDYKPVGKVEINRTNIGLEDSAKSIQVFNEDFLFDYQPQTLTDIVTMSSNTSFSGDNNGRNNVYIIRGFSGVPVLRDGFNLNNAITNTEIFNFERVEVLKGPDSLQYGEANPGGLINLVKKKPQKENHGEIQLEVKSNPSFSPKIDVGGAINSDGSLRYRLVSSYLYEEDTKDFNTDTKRVFIAPSVAYDINDHHTVTFMTEYLDETTPADYGTFVNSKGKIVGDKNLVTSSPDAEFDKTQQIIGFDITSTFDTWDSNFRYRYIDLSRDNDSIYNVSSYNETTNQILRYFATQHFDSDEHAAQFTINKEFKIANMRNRISLGVDAKRSDTETNGYFDTSIPYYLNASNPVYIPLTSLSDHPAAFEYVNTNTITKSFGGFIQDHLNITDDLIFSAGIRYDKVKSENLNRVRATFQEYNSSAYTPQFGLVYKITSQTSIYANFSKSFNPQSSTYISSDGELLDPEEGKGFEVGLKQKLFNDNFTLTSALFKIEKENVAQTDPANALYYVASGKQKSEGFEVDLAGEILPGWSLIGSYGYTKTKDVDNSNNELTGVPKHSANFFTTYDLGQIGLKNMYVGAGARFLGTRYANTSNTIKLDSTIIYNAMLGYKKDNWKVNLSLKNITDELYAETASTSRVQIGEPRSAMLTVSYSF